MHLKYLLALLLVVNRVAAATTKVAIVVALDNVETRILAYEMATLSEITQIGPSRVVRPGLVTLATEVTLDPNRTMSEFTNTVAAIGRATRTLAKTVASSVPSVSQWPIYVGATGAARHASVAVHQLLIKAMRDELKTVHVRILSGEEEAAFGLLSLQSQPWNIVKNPGDFGWLEMTLTSLQIAWVTDGLIYEHFFPLPPVLAPFPDANVFARSFPELGLQSFGQAMLPFMINRSSTTTPDPEIAACISSKLPGTWQACRQLTLRIVDFPTWYVYRQPPLVPSCFMLTGLFRTVLSAQLGLQLNNSTVTVAEVQVAAQNTCATQGPSVACIQGVLVNVVLADLFNLGQQTLHIWQDQEKDEEQQRDQTRQEIGWPRGAALYRNWETVAHSLVVRQVSDSDFLSVLSVFEILILVLMAWMLIMLGRRVHWWRCCKANNKRRDLERMQRAIEDAEREPFSSRIDTTSELQADIASVLDQ